MIIKIDLFVHHFLGKDKQGELKFPQKNEMKFSCTYCGISFHLENQLRAHCATENHQTVIMSDEGRDWKWRPPPRGFSSECYTYANLHKCLIDHFTNSFQFVDYVKLFRKEKEQKTYASMVLNVSKHMVWKN